MPPRMGITTDGPCRRSATRQLRHKDRVVSDNRPHSVAAATVPTILMDRPSTCMFGTWIGNGGAILVRASRLVVRASRRNEPGSETHQVGLTRDACLRKNGIEVSLGSPRGNAQVCRGL